jgi:hypothetical protein
MKFAVLSEEFKSFLYHTVSLTSVVVKKTFEFFARRVFQSTYFEVPSVKSSLTVQVPVKRK